MPEPELEFEKKDTIAELFISVDSVLREGRFSEASQLLETVMEHDFDHPLLFENMRAIGFWKNREGKISSLSGVPLGRQLIDYFDEFTLFCERKGGTDISVYPPVKHFVFTKARTVLEEALLAGESSVLSDIGRALMEQSEHAKAVEIFERILKTDRYNAWALGYLSEAYRILHEEERSSLYLREALFYDPLMIPYGRIAHPLIASLAVMARSEGFAEEEEVRLWLGMYGEISGILSVRRKLAPEETVNLRKTIAKLEADLRAGVRKSRTEPRLLLAYAWLIGERMIDESTAGDARITGEIELIMKKMRSVNDTIAGRFAERMRRQ
ncbi:MAG: hypothetical protein AABZ39_14435 [Spirochaetota bacterium]